MARVICDRSVSIDGYVTGPDDSREHPFGDGAEGLHDWISGTATDDDRALPQDVVERTSAVVMGRTSFDKNQGDGGLQQALPLITPAATHLQVRVLEPSLASSSSGHPS